MALRRRGLASALATNLISRAASASKTNAFTTPRPFSPPFSTLCNGGNPPGTTVDAARFMRSELERRYTLINYVNQRNLAAESPSMSLSEKWRQSRERIRESLLEKPRAVVESVKQSELAEGTRGAVTTISTPIRRTLISYREAFKLQLEAFWRRNYLVVVGAVGLAACLLLWKIMFGVASLFISLSEGLAKYGFLALAAAVVSFSGMMLKARHTVNPDAVYRIAMRKLNTSAEVLKALGAPLSGTDIRAYVMTGGGLRINNMKPRLSSKRCFLIFPVQGSERRGLVSIETKKKQGQYDFKLLAVDVAGTDGRIYVVGDDAEYKIGGGLIAELRDPIVKAMAAQNEFEAQDDREEREAEQEEKSKQAAEQEEKSKQAAAA